MNFSEQFIQIMDEVSKKFGITVDWTAQNVMPYLNDLLGRFVKYEVYTSLMWLVIGVIVFILSIKAVRWSWKSENDCEGFIAFMIGLAAIGFIMITTQTLDIIQVKTIPEKTVVEYIQYLKDND